MFIKAENLKDIFSLKALLSSIFVVFICLLCSIHIPVKESVCCKNNICKVQHVYLFFRKETIVDILKTNLYIQENRSYENDTHITYVLKPIFYEGYLTYYYADNDLLKLENYKLSLKEYKNNKIKILKFDAFMIFALLVGMIYFLVLLANILKILYSEKSKKEIIYLSIIFVSIILVILLIHFSL